MNKTKSLALLLTACAFSPLVARAQNVEDDPIEDTPVPAVPVAPGAAPAAPNPAPAAPPTPAEAPPVAEAPTIEAPAAPAAETPLAAPATGTPATAVPAASLVGDTVTVPREVWEKLLRDVDDLKKARDAVAANPAPVPAPAAPPTEAPEPPVANSGNRNYLALPDISLILQGKGSLSSDSRDDGRRKFGLAEGELGIQSYVYPGVKADAFITGAPAENEPFQFEEGYLTFQSVAKGLSINAGRKFTPFGRTGELHNHSWLYPRQLLPIQNLVSEEALTGDGIGLNYLLPLKGKTFVRTSFGAWSGEGTDVQYNSSNPGDAFFGDVPVGPGAGYTRRFYTGRVWAGHPVGENGEFELGYSRAQGRSEMTDDTGVLLQGHVNLTGVDASYRHFLNGGKRLLLRSEYFKYNPDGLYTSPASGYYGLANLRLNPRQDVGLLYESSGFPQAPGERETALSLIYTKQFTEQYYGRVMATHGDRPGGGYDELRFQFVAGLGPHTHALE